MKPRTIRTWMLLDRDDDASEVALAARFYDVDEHDDIEATVGGCDVELSVEQLERAEEGLRIAYAETIQDERERDLAHAEDAAEWRREQSRGRL